MHRPTLAIVVAAALLAGCVRAPSPESPAPSAPPPSAPPAPVVVAPAPAAAPAADSACPATDLVVAATTDVHGRLRAWDYYADAPEAVRGLTRAATVVDSIRAANPGRVLLVDAGDLLQGNPMTYVAARVSGDTLSPVVAAMNAMHYDAAAIGNHEYNYGLAILARAVGQASFPFLSANTFRANGDPAFRTYTIVERSGVRVGIVGATTPGVAVWDRDNVAGRLRFGDIVPAVRDAVARVRREGADVVVVLLHSGLDEPSSYDTVSTGVPSENVSARVAREVPGIDLLVFGHSHKELSNRFEGSTLLLQPKNWATSVGVAHLPVAGCRGERHVVAGRATSAVIQAAGHAESPEVLAATERAHREAVAYVTTPIGTSTTLWRGDSARVADTPLIDFVLEVERKAANADLASTAAFTLDAKIDSGPVTVAELARLYSYDNTLRAVRISGKQLRDYLEHSARYYRTYTPGDTSPATDPEVPGYNFDIVSGVDYVLDLSKPVGSRVTRLRFRNRDVAPADSFTMALNNYRQTGGGGFAMLRGAPVVYDRQQEIRQLLIDEVRRKRTIRPEDYFKQNWRIVPPEAVTRAYEAGRRASGEGVPATTSAAPAGSSDRRPATPVATAPPAPGTTRLRIISTNDFHGALEARPGPKGTPLGGAGAVAAAIAGAQNECIPVGCQTLVVDGGDEFQGTPASNLAFGKPVAEVFNTIGYAAAALGNHEFDWGQDTLRSLMRTARYGILGANVRYTDGRDVEWIPNDTIVTRGPLSIGIIGIALETTPAETRAANTVGLRFDPPAPIVDSLARVLRGEGADAIVVLAHAGAFCSGDGSVACKGDIIDLARDITEPVDAIVSGHTHSLVDATVRGIPIVQAYKSGRAIGVIDLDVARAGRKPATFDSTAVPRAEVREVATANYPAEPRADAIARRAAAAVADRVDTPVATIAVTMKKGKRGEQYALGNLLADAQRWAAKSDIAVMNNGGIRSDLRAGPATYGTLFELQPFGNVLYQMTATGAEIRRYFEALGSGDGPDEHISGAVATYDLSRPDGSRLVSLTLPDGRPLDDAATYTIVMNDFMATGRDGLALQRASRATKNLNIVDLDALVAYLKAQASPVRPPEGARVVSVAR